MTSVTYSIPYVLLLIFFGILSVFYERGKRENAQTSHLICLLGFFMFVFFFGFRGFVFHDWFSYYPEFEKVEWYDLSNYTFGNIHLHEPGWLLYILIIKTLTNSYHFMVFIVTVIEACLLYSFLKRYCDNPMLAIMVYLAFEGFPNTCNTMRNMLAMLIVLNGLRYIEQRNFLKYFLICTLAFSIHYSSIIYVPLYFFFHKRLPKYVFLTIVIVSNLIFILHLPIALGMIKMFNFGDDFLETKIEVYSEMRTGRGLGLGFIERLLTAVLIYCYYDKLASLKKENIMFINAFVLFLFFFSFFSDFDEISKRLSLLFVFGYWIIWPEMTKCFYRLNNKRLFFSFLYIYCILRVVTTVNHPVVEYDNILFGSKSYQERKYIFDKTFEDEEDL